MPRVSRMKVAVAMDGKSVVTVTLTPHAGGGDWTVGVRPLGLRLEYTGLLSDVAKFIQARHAKFLVGQSGVVVPRARK